MELHDHSIRDALKSVYRAFEAALRDSFVSIVTQPNSVGFSAYLYNFDKRSVELSSQYVELIDTLTALYEKDSEARDFERLTLILKLYIAEDIKAMQKALRTFIIRASGSARLGQNRSTTQQEILTMFNEPKTYNLANLGRKSKRII